MAPTRLPADPVVLVGWQPEMQQWRWLGSREAGLVDALRPGVEQGCNRVLVGELQQPRGHESVHRLQEGVGICNRAAGLEHQAQTMAYTSSSCGVLGRTCSRRYRAGIWGTSHSHGHSPLCARPEPQGTVPITETLWVSAIEPCHPDGTP